MTNHYGNYGTQVTLPTKEFKYKSDELIEGEVYQIYKHADATLGIGCLPITPRMIVVGMFVSTKKNMFGNSHMFLTDGVDKFLSDNEYYFLKVKTNDDTKS